ncbi:hypothetical protein C8Q75DRAFT_771575 [Abortiporus biennis]|nr:hypothetical protein C8Q75DRAFT_771575 [Abortiporus biennis]
MFNNGPLILHLAASLHDATTSPKHEGKKREKASGELCLVSRLPSTAFLQREAEYLLPKLALKQLRRSPSPTLSEDEDGNSLTSEESPQSQSQSGEENGEDTRKRRPSMTSILSSLSSATSNTAKSLISPRKKEAGVWKDPEPYEVLRAVERKDIMFLMEIRDRAFHLLVRKSGDVTPLLHAMRIGKSHQEVAIILLGAFSRYINQLSDEEMALSKTKVLLRALRTNLKLAIDFGLQQSQRDLIASFLQTLIMSEGDKWVSAQMTSVAHALRVGPAGQPVKMAEDAVRSFATRELGKVKGGIATLEDYIANATSDLVMMAAWSWVLESVNGEQIPAWYFARDDRVFKAFIDRLDQHKRAIERTCNRRLKWQLRVLRQVMDGRSTSFRTKVETLAQEFDEGNGI